MKHLKVNCPKVRGDEHPKFDELAVNESAFEDSLRFKEASISIDEAKNICNVSWLSQEDDEPTIAFNKEIVRAFKANGVFPGTRVKVKFGSRSTDLINQYDLIV